MYAKIVKFVIMPSVIEKYEVGVNRVKEIADRGAGCVTVTMEDGSQLTFDGFPNIITLAKVVVPANEAKAEKKPFKK